VLNRQLIMNKQSPEKSHTFPLVRSASLAALDACLPGPLHTILVDISGNLYFSDEFNHRVVSLDPEGNIRWAQGKKGKSAGAFIYPRGLSFGQIEIAGGDVQCIGVADAWNHRVQFLDLEGNPVHAWTGVDSCQFSEIADIRFVTSAVGEVCWLVLDKGSHRLYGVNPKGILLFQIGQAFPYNLQTRWAVPGMFFGFPENVPAFDFLYYPERILGNSMDALFISEPYSGSLKQLLPPHLLPIALDANKQLEYVAADDSGLLCWDRRDNQVIRYDNEGLVYYASFNGMPIASSSLEFWIQNSKSLDLYRWEHPPDAIDKLKNSRSSAFLRWTAPLEKSRSDMSEIREAVEFCFNAAHEEADLAGRIASIAQKGSDEKILIEEENRYIPLQLNRCWALLRLRKALHHWCVGSLEEFLAGHDRKISADQAEIMDLAKHMLNQLMAKIVDMIEQMDEFLLTLQSPITDEIGSNIPVEKRNKAIADARNDIVDIQIWMGACLGFKIY
jgi:hypothetical protein